MNVLGKGFLELGYRGSQLSVNSEQSLQVDSKEDLELHAAWEDHPPGNK